MSFTGPALGMALAYAVSGLSQMELCSFIYGTQFREQPLQFLPSVECVPGDFLPRMPCSSSPLKIASCTPRDRKPNSLATKIAPLVFILPDGRMSLFDFPLRSLTLPPCHQGQGATI